MNPYPSQPPPAGGFGAPQPHHHGYGPGAPLPPKKTSTGVVIAIVAGVVLLVLVGIIGTLAVLGVYGTRRYIANAKRAEARASLGRLAMGAATAYEESDLADTSNVAVLCPSARRPVPAALESVSGKKYMSAASEWSEDPGFSCLRFEQSAPQYYQYD